MERERKLGRYLRIRDQLAELIRRTPDPIAQRATAAALIHHKTPGVSWSGFYMLRNGQLVVDAYQGPVACLVLEAHKGVCWAAIDRNESIVVQDVHTFPGHIACDGRTLSEIVVPLRDASGAAIGVLDLDSHRTSHFDDADREGLEAIVEVLGS
jgi:GAF domain-containing protein